VKGVASLFEQFLRSRSLRLTKQREAILKAIYATHDHISADDLYDELMDDAGSKELKISRATVYRTLSLLTEGGFIQALDIGRDQGRLYEHVMGHEHHDHMVCLVCDDILEFHDEDLEQVQARAVEKHGFKASSHRLNVFGTCRRCLAEGKEAEGSPAEAPGPAEAGSEGTAGGC
jgi:Fur family ferric uptake transcriptional regulator